MRWAALLPALLTAAGALEVGELLAPQRRVPRRAALEGLSIPGGEAEGARGDGADGDAAELAPVAESCLDERALCEQRPPTVSAADQAAWDECLATYCRCRPRGVYYKSRGVCFHDTAPGDVCHVLEVCLPERNYCQREVRRRILGSSPACAALTECEGTQRTIEGEHYACMEHLTTSYPDSNCDFDAACTGRAPSRSSGSVDVPIHPSVIVGIAFAVLVWFACTVAVACFCRRWRAPEPAAAATEPARAVRGFGRSGSSGWLSGVTRVTHYRHPTAAQVEGAAKLEIVHLEPAGGPEIALPCFCRGPLGGCALGEPCPAAGCGCIVEECIDLTQIFLGDPASQPTSARASIHTRAEWEELEDDVEMDNINSPQLPAEVPGVQLTPVGRNTELTLCSVRDSDGERSPSPGVDRQGLSAPPPSPPRPQQQPRRRRRPPCAVCLDGPCDVLFLPCKHMAACTVCAPRIVVDGKCHLCRAVVQCTVDLSTTPLPAACLAPLMSPVSGGLADLDVSPVQARDPDSRR
eukprot:TRINITY_DN56018_c0_g1_i1.p1 TRINITY_DN56018_c0_g1~~TRINITY_DN56018_c0_g1_i1.p1  ORF type:complete len:548 (+),score=130.93 TRINITY_DN56018_c0_g1_i1:76-1644(+)